MRKDTCDKIFGGDWKFTGMQNRVFSSFCVYLLKLKTAV